LILDTKEIQSPYYISSLLRAGKILELKAISIRDFTKYNVSLRHPEEDKRNCYSIFLNLDGNQDKFFRLVDTMIEEEAAVEPSNEIFSLHHIGDFDEIIKAYYQRDKPKVMKLLAKL
jgi:hypothetical protein